MIDFLIGEILEAVVFIFAMIIIAAGFVIATFYDHYLAGIGICMLGVMIALFVPRRV